MEGIPFTLNSNSEIEPCPECNNNTKFKARSRQVAEDLCDVWVTCGNCGYDPFESPDEGPMNKIESVWGEIDRGNCLMALEEWNNLISPEED